MLRNEVEGRYKYRASGLFLHFPTDTVQLMSKQLADRACCPNNGPIRAGKSMINFSTRTSTPSPYYDYHLLLTGTATHQGGFASQREQGPVIQRANVTYLPRLSKIFSRRAWQG